MTIKRSAPRKQAKVKTGGKSPSKPEAEKKRRHYLPASERRRKILESAQQVFARSGLKGARTRELAQAAGINQATLFEHFSSKEELFSAAVVEPLAGLIEGARERARAYAKAGSDEDRLPLLRQGMLQNLEGMVSVFPLLVQALFSEREMGEFLYREKIVPLLRARAETMRSINTSEIDHELLQLASFGMFFAVAMDQHMTGKSRNLEEVAGQLTDLIMFGCSSEDRSPRRKRHSK